MKKLLLAGLGLLLSTFVFSQKITGKITDEKGEPLLGASVLLLETKQGTMTDAQGNFELVMEKSGIYTLRTSFVGYETDQRPVEVGEEVIGPIPIKLEASATLLQTLTVTAVRAGEKSPFTYTNVGSDALQSRNLGQDVPYLLDATPSIVTTSDAGAGVGYTGLRIRGTDASRINVTINGVPLNDAESQGVYWVDLPDVVASTESIQIQRGVGTSTNGGGAFGASINLNTNALQAKPYIELAGTAGSFNTHKVSLKLGSGIIGKNAKATKTGFTVDARGSLINSDGFIDRASSELRSAYFSPAYIGKKFTLRGMVLHGDERTYQAWYGVPAQYIGIDSLRSYNPAGMEKPGEPYENQVDDYRQTHAQLIYNQQVGKNWHFNLTGHYTRGLGFYEEYKRGQLNLDYEVDFDPPIFFGFIDLVRRKWLDNHFYGGIGSVNYQSPNRRVELMFGVAANRYNGDHYGTVEMASSFNGETLVYTPGQRYYDDGGEKEDFNGFAKVQLALTPQLHGFIDLQARRVRYNVEAEDRTDPANYIYRYINTDFDFFNPKAGLFYEPNLMNSLYISFAVAQKEPNRDDFVDAPTDMQPKPERLYNTEMGWRYRARQFDFGLNFYQMFYKDQLVLTGRINDTGAAIRTNVANSYRLGTETTLRIFLSKQFILDANATLSINKIKKFTGYSDNWDFGSQGSTIYSDTDIAFSPKSVAFCKITWAASPSFLDDGLGFTASLALKHVGKQQMDNTSSPFAMLPAYNTCEAQLRYVMRPKFCKELSFNLLVQNLLNSRYSSNAWTYRFYSQNDYSTGDPYITRELGNVYRMIGYYPQAGRNFLLGVTVGF